MHVKVIENIIQYYLNVIEIILFENWSLKRMQWQGLF